MSRIKMFMFPECPHCQLALSCLEHLQQNSPYKELEIEIIDENRFPEKIKGYDYYYVPTFFVGEKKAFEGHMECEDVKAVLDMALGTDQGAAEQKKQSLVFLADGFETLEALSLVDVWRRAGLDVKTVSFSTQQQVLSDQGVEVSADLLAQDLPSPDLVELIYVPGGLKAVNNLREHETCISYLQKARARAVPIATICAGPAVLAQAGISQELRGTCYPGCEDMAQYREHLDQLHAADDHVYSSRGPSTALPFALELLAHLHPDKAEQVQKAMLYPYLKAHIQEGLKA